MTNVVEGFKARDADVQASAFYDTQGMGILQGNYGSGAKGAKTKFIAPEQMQGMDQYVWRARWA